MQYTILYCKRVKRDFYFAKIIINIFNMRIILYYISKNALYARHEQSFDTFKNILWTTRTK